MPKQIILRQNEAQELIQQIVNKSITRTWRGYGSAIFFEIGELNKEDIGEFTFMIDRAWILCLGDQDCISCDSLELNEMDQLLDKFIGSKISDIKLAVGQFLD
jgi:hypothetical protein